MSPGFPPLTVERGGLNSPQIDALLQHPYFLTRNRAEQTMFFDVNSNLTDFQQNVVDVAGKYVDENVPGYVIQEIETWAQDFSSSGRLAPHCDHNCRYTVDYPMKHNLSHRGEWIFALPEEQIVSPITIALYLDVSEDMDGGEFVLSHRSWKDEPQPLNIPPEHFDQFDSTTVVPKTGDVVIFKGSLFYHWIAPIRAGTRRSLLINFWPRNDK